MDHVKKCVECSVTVVGTWRRRGVHAVGVRVVAPVAGVAARAGVAPGTGRLRPRAPVRVPGVAELRLVLRVLPAAMSKQQSKYLLLYK